MRKWFLWVAAAILVITVQYLLFPHDRSDSTLPEELPASSSSADPMAKVVDSTAKMTTPHTTPFPHQTEIPHHPLAISFGASAESPEEESRILLEILDAYRRMNNGHYPVAEDNRQMMKLMTGQGRSGLSMFPNDHPRLNSRGELTDRWKTPYFFHCISSRHIEIRSAGPDEQLFTNDDIVVPDRPPTTPL